MSGVRIAVIGLGAMGRNHARILSDLDGAILAAVCDSVPEVVAWAGAKFTVPAYASYRQMLEREELDGAIVATPTGYHAELALAVLARGVHVLVEKPIASELEEARRLVATAANAGRVLTVGHVERFNPAIRELRWRLLHGELGRVFKIHARRCGPFPSRIRDVGVVIDLATHDLDLMPYLLDTEVVRVYAETARRIHTDHEDMLNALLRFANGTVGVLDVDWLTPTKVRDLSVLGERGMFHVDYLTQDLSFYENDATRGNWDALGVPGSVREGNMTRFHIERAEPLRQELEAFVRVIASGEAPQVTGDDGVRALHLALELVAAGERGTPVDLSPATGAVGRAA
jgi:predicted dehydrogenase